MAPNVEDCEGERLRALEPMEPGSPARTAGAGCRVLPGERAPAEAWLEDEALERFVPASCSSPDKTKASKKKHVSSKLQAGLALGARGPAGRHMAVRAPGSAAAAGKPKVKTKFQKRKDRLMELLRPPYFILTIILVVVGAHAAGGARLAARLEWAPGAWRAEPWRALSYHLVHADAAHLALNALVALVVGWCIEREQGWARAAAVWAGGALGGALGAGALQPRVRVVGASAAVYAMLTAHIPNVCLRFGHVSLWWFRPLSVGVLCMSEVCWTVARGALAAPAPVPVPAAGGGAAQLAARWTHHAPEPEEHVAWAAHAAGALVGLLMGFVVFTGENAGARGRGAARAACAVMLGAPALLAVGFYAQAISAPAPTEPT